MSRKRLWIGLAFAVAAALVLGWFATAKLRHDRANAIASNAEMERALTAYRSCRAAMRARDPDAEAEADVRRGIVQPIVVQFNGFYPETVALGLNHCPQQDRPRSPRPFPRTCRGSLTGPNRLIQTYALAYNQRLQALAPRQVEAACRRPSRRPAGTGAVRPASRPN